MLRCEAGKSSTAGSHNCTDCAAGKYNDNEGGECLDCAAGKTSEAGKLCAQIVLRVNHHREVSYAQIAPQRVQ